MISLLIPTYNRAETAIGTVHAWRAQACTREKEIIVLDDGSEPEHAAMLEAHLHNVAGVRLIRQNNKGLAAARNRLIDEANGTYLYFIDDDIRPGNEHTLEHATQRVIATGQPVVGRTRVPPEYRATVVQELWHQRFVNGTKNFVDGQQLGVTEFWFAAMIMPRAALHGERFAADFTGYGWEEHELGYRLYQHGVRVQFRADLWYEHLDSVTFSGLLKKYEAMGAQGVTFAQLHPGLRVGLLTGSAWISCAVKTILGYEFRGERALKKFAQYADERFVAKPGALQVLARDLFTALEGAYFRGTKAALHEVRQNKRAKRT